jgi:uncharacterized protein (DUF1810 family)
VTREDGDPFNLRRFVDAQNQVYERVVAELSQGRKTSHWMWFIFPQIEGLGASPLARKYAISSVAEAKAYLAHPILGPRLRECVGLVNRIEDQQIGEIFAAPDDMKFRSSMTLFGCATDDNLLFKQALAKYFAGAFDPLTLERL